MNNQKIVLEPKTQAFVDALAAQGGKPLYELSYADARKVLEDAQTSAKVTKLPADVEDKMFPVGPNGSNCRNHLPSQRVTGFPACGDVLPRWWVGIGQQEYS